MVKPVVNSGLCKYIAPLEIMRFFVVMDIIGCARFFIAYLESVIAIIGIDESFEPVGEPMVETGVEVHEMVAYGSLLIFIPAIDDRKSRNDEQVIPRAAKTYEIGGFFSYRTRYVESSGCQAEASGPRVPVL